MMHSRRWGMAYFCVILRRRTGSGSPRDQAITDTICHLFRVRPRSCFTDSSFARSTS